MAFSAMEKSTKLPPIKTFFWWKKNCWVWGFEVLIGIRSDVVVVEQVVYFPYLPLESVNLHRIINGVDEKDQCSSF